MSHPSIDRSLAALLSATPVVEQHGSLPVPLVSQVEQDSRALVPGACFVAVPGFRVDGHAYLDAAIDAGATTLVVRADRRALWAPVVQAARAAMVVVPDTRAALANMAAAFHGFPGRALIVVGVTGTDGKSTTTYLTTAILEAAGHPGLIGGVQFKVGDAWRMNTITQSSPEAPLVQSLLAAIRDAGGTHAVVESTSHGLALHRLDHCEYDVGVFTGLSNDHLDFHGTPAAYLDAKLELFRALDTAEHKGVPKRAVVNADDPRWEAVRDATRAELVPVGLDAPHARVVAADVKASATGSAFRLITPHGEAPVDLPLPGRFNISNALCAAGAGVALDFPVEAIARGLSAFRGVPGRMERIDAGQPFGVIVDAAATTDAFRVVLASLRPLVTGRLIVVFGCAGERDPGRRTGMGAVAAEFADHAVITSENPRSEDPAAIVRTIADAMRAAGHSQVAEEPDPAAAIARALSLAAPDDLVLIAGKGAEQTLIYGETVQPWDDRHVAQSLGGAAWPDPR